MSKRLLQLCVLLLFLSGYAVKADSKNSADYPLRFQIFARTETTFYQNHVADEAKGEGRANLFEKGDVHGVDFSYTCDNQLKVSFGYETYRARWKKPGEELTLLLPVFGKKNAFFTCTLKTDVKSYAYSRSNNGLHTMAPEKIKEWMAAHDYDPEHDKNEPVNVVGPRSGASAAQSGTAPPSQ